jgi:Tol biopolymer transport system component
MNGLRQDRASLHARFGLTSGGTLAYASGGNVTRNRRLMILDRQGNSTDWSPERRAYEYGIGVSPDGSRLLTTINNVNAITELWVSKRGESTSRRVRSLAGADVIGDCWSADGRWIAFALNANGPGDGIYVTDGEGIEDPRLLARKPTPTAAIIPASWSADGTMLATVVDSARVSVWSLHAPPGVSALATPKPVLLGKDIYALGVFSPDGRLVAYQSSETGLVEVYVSAWSGDGPAGQPIQVSRGSGNIARWGRDGKQLYYTSQGKLMSATITATPQLSASAPALAWDLPALHVVPNNQGGGLWDLLPDGRLVAVQMGEDEEAVTQVKIALHFDEVVKQKLRAAK